MIGEKRYEYLRPAQTRSIPLKAMSNRGNMPSLKKHLQGFVLEYESQLEHDFYLLLDHDPNCIDLQPQPIEINYKTKSGREVSVYPDCWAIFKDGREFLFEIKTESQFQKLIYDENWDLRTKAIMDLCQKMNWTYQVFTNRKIHCTRLNNIKDLLVAAKQYSPANISEYIGTFNSSLKHFVKNEHLNLRTLADLLSATIHTLDLKEIIALLKYKIYFLQVSINWNEPLEETKIFLDDVIPIPIYELPDDPLSNEDNGYKTTSPPSAETPKISALTQKIFDERFGIISPLIDKFGKDGKKSQILEYCNENNLPFETTYRYYRIWRKRGKTDLVPKMSKKHKKSHLDPTVEDLLQDIIDNWNHGKWTQIKAAYNEFCIKCQKLGLKPAVYTTFRLRVQSLPAVELRGKFTPKTQSFIKRGWSGTYQEGRYPGCLIQMDHTKLDIWLVDKFTKQPFARPWLTMGVDTFSRSIWGFFLSFDPPSQESVTQTILSGLMRKEELKEWKLFESRLLNDGKDPHLYKISCAGFPARIQVDNSKEFMAENVKDFCMKLNISLEFRPIKTPEFGGGIESIWDTINDAIRNAKLPGRVFSLPKSRESVSSPKINAPPDYNAKQDAALTLDQFQEWLFSYFVAHSNEKKAGQLHSPNERWSNGLIGDQQLPLGGALRLLSPADYLHFDFETKRTIRSRLSKRGFRYGNIYYSSKWLHEARKDKILIDGNIYEFKISHWDVRYIQIINPRLNEIETLQAYKYAGDDRITKLIQIGLGNIPGYRSFPISMNMIEYANQILKEPNSYNNAHLLIMDDINQKLQKSIELNKSEKAFLENSNLEGVDFKKVLFEEHPKEGEIPSISKNQVDTKQEVKKYPTEREEVKKEMLYWKLFELRGDE